MGEEEAAEELGTAEEEEVEDEAEEMGVNRLLLLFIKKQAQLQDQAQVLAQALDQGVRLAQEAMNEPRLRFRGCLRSK